MAKHDDDNSFNNIFYIPQNYTDAGKILNGMFDTRNLVEAIVVAGGLLFLETKLTASLETPVKVIIMLLTVLPVGIFALVGIDGFSLLEYLENVFKYLKNKRKLHFRRVGVKNAGSKKDKSVKKASGSSGKKEKARGKKK